jgi:hypothetical protein
MARRKKNNKGIEFLMETDWLFEKPIDQEHKEYKLLSYFQKMGEKLDNMELYPGFIELSLHLVSIQTLIKDRKLIYTDKKFETIDDELLVKDLKTKSIPKLSDDEMVEFINILKFSAPRVHEYFNIAKSVWTIVYDTIELKLKKNKKNISQNKGFFYYLENKTNNLYVWEYNIKNANRSSIEKKTQVNLIYSKPKNNLTLPKIIDTFSTWFSEEEKSKLPLFEMKSKDLFPINETLLPLFKRKVISYINLENYNQRKKAIQIKVN